MLVQTDLRVHPVATARNVSYEPTAPLTANDVQSAIEQVQAEVAAVIIAPRGYNPTIVTFAQSPYTPLISDTVLMVDTTGGVVVIAMPLSATRLVASGYLPLTVKDDKGNSAVNAISVTRAGAELIDGLTAYPIDSPYTSVTFQPKSTGGYDAV